MGFYGTRWLNQPINESSGYYNIILAKVKYNIRVGQFSQAKNCVYKSKLSKSEKEYLASFIDKEDPYYKGKNKSTAKINLNDFFPDIEKDIKNIEKKLLNSDYKDKIRKSIDEGIENDFIHDKKYINDSKKIPTLKCTLEEDYFVIIDDDQMVRVQLSWILEDIIEELKKIHKYKDIYFNTGDGDEGCIYCC